MIGHSYTQDEIEQKVDAFWRFTKGFPIPRKRLSCPVCGSQETIIKSFRYFKKNGPATIKHRCDVVVKCTVCSATWAHGVPISEEVFDGKIIKHKNKNSRTFTWRMALCQIEKKVKPQA
jgi:hypothetical protein